MFKEGGVCVCFEQIDGVYGINVPGKHLLRKDKGRVAEQVGEDHRRADWGRRGAS